jgi:hypothetical protein
VSQGYMTISLIWLVMFCSEVLWQVWKPDGDFADVMNRDAS